MPIACLNEPLHVKMTFAPNAFLTKKLWLLSSVKILIWRAKAQAGLNLCRARMLKGTFSDVAVHIKKTRECSGKHYLCTCKFSEFCRSLNRVSAYAASQATLLCMKNLMKPTLCFSSFCVFFVFKDNVLDFYFTSLQLVLSAVWLP